jgi:uncharacterized phage protein (TIGR01671 family)
MIGFKEVLNLPNKNVREIKLRAWDKTKQKMFTPHQMDAYGTVVINVIHAPGETHPEEYPNPYELMQFTGLLDKNGKEIWGGDILRFWEGEHRECKEEVYFESGTFGTKGFNGISALVEKMPKDDRLFDILSFAEVIGNIYENPELLK